MSRNSVCQHCISHCDAELTLRQTEKFFDRGSCPRRVFFFGRVSKVFKYDEFAAGDFAMEAFSIGRQDQAIAPAPNDQRRQFELGDALHHEPRLPLSRAIDQRAPVTGALGEFDRALDLLLRDLAGVAVDIAEPCSTRKRGNVCSIRELISGNRRS